METRQEEVLIVSKTKMKDDVCIGGIGLTSKKNLRLLKEHLIHRVPTKEELLKSLEERRLVKHVESDMEINIQEEKTSAKQWGDQQKDCNIGEVWLVSYYHSPVITNPHTEDVIVKKAELIKNFSDEELKSYILKSGVTIWKGGLDLVFSGLLKFTSKGSAYIAHNSELPLYSVGFWIPETDLVAQHDGYKIRYCYDSIKMKFVGLQAHKDIIPKGTLVRLSLPRVWHPDPPTPAGYYLQLSGWYD